MIKNIDVICRSFLWTGFDVIFKKSLISWKQVCTLKDRGGLNMVSLEEWNKENMAKLLWNLSGKKDNLWIKWVHTYYFKGVNFMNVHPTQNALWIIKAIVKQ